MSRSKTGRSVFLCLLAGLAASGCAHSRAKIDAVDVPFNVAVIGIYENTAYVFPKSLPIRNHRQIAVWVLGEGFAPRDELMIQFQDGEFQQATQVFCKWRICAMNIPPSLSLTRGGKQAFKYDGWIQRGQTKIPVDPQVEVVDY